MMTAVYVEEVYRRRTSYFNYRSRGIPTFWGCRVSQLEFFWSVRTATTPTLRHCSSQLSRVHADAIKNCLLRTQVRLSFTAIHVMVDYPLLAVIVTALLAQRCSQTDQLSASERLSVWHVTTLYVIISLSE